MMSSVENFPYNNRQSDHFMHDVCCYETANASWICMPEVNDCIGCSQNIFQQAINNNIIVYIMLYRCIF